VEALVPTKETLNPFSGRVVLETSNSLVVSASNSGVMQIALSILENANT
jgi:RNase P/RNase MRP subunit p29